MRGVGLGRDSVSAPGLAPSGGWNVTGGAAFPARRELRSADLFCGVGCSGVLNGAREVRERSASRPAWVGGFSSIRRSLVAGEHFHPLRTGRGPEDRFRLRLCPGQARVDTRRVGGGILFAPAQGVPVSSTVGGLRAAGETSPSLVYGAALLMRLGSYSPSRVRIPESPRVEPVCMLAKH